MASLRLFSFIHCLELSWFEHSPAEFQERETVSFHSFGLSNLFLGICKGEILLVEKNMKRKTLRPPTEVSGTVTVEGGGRALCQTLNLGYWCFPPATFRNNRFF